MDFTFADPKDRAQQIARLDLRATYDSGVQRLEGRITLSFVPLAGDPFDPLAMDERAVFTFTGRKIDAP